MLLKLGLCIVITCIIHLTSSQPTYHIVHQENDACSSNERVLSELVTVVSQLQRSVAKLNAAIEQKERKGKSIFKKLQND